jgi:hypothetical protein
MALLAGIAPMPVDMFSFSSITPLGNLNPIGKTMYASKMLDNAYIEHLLLIEVVTVGLHEDWFLKRSQYDSQSVATGVCTKVYKCRRLRVKMRCCREAENCLPVHREGSRAVSAEALDCYLTCHTR